MLVLEEGALPAKLIENSDKLYFLFTLLNAPYLQKYRLGKQSCKESTDNSKDGMRLGLFKFLITIEFVHSIMNMVTSSFYFFSLVPLMYL